MVSGICRSPRRPAGRRGPGTASASENANAIAIEDKFADDDVETAAERAAREAAVKAAADAKARTELAKKKIAV